MTVIYRYLNPVLYECADEPTSLQFSGNWEKLTIEKYEEEGFFLLCHFLNGHTSDTWHFSVEEAKQQAKFEFNINEDDWEAYPSA
jgi:hypothetical protein